MVLNLSITINEAQTQEMIGAKRDFFFKFIKKDVAALRYQVAQEHITMNRKILTQPQPQLWLSLAQISPSLLNDFYRKGMRLKMINNR